MDARRLISVMVTLRETSPFNRNVYILLEPPPGAHPVAKKPSATPPLRPKAFAKPKAAWKKSQRT